MEWLIERTKSALKQEADSRECGDKGDVCWYSCPFVFDDFELMLFNLTFAVQDAFDTFSCSIKIFKWWTPKMNPWKVMLSLLSRRKKNMFINIDFKEKLQRYLFCIVMLKSLYSTFPKQLRKNCSTPLFISFLVSWSVRKCRFDVVLATTTRCLWRPLVLQATWQNTFLFMWCFLMLMFAGILGRGFAWTSFVWDGLKQPTTCRSVLQNKGQIWICLNVILYDSMHFVFVGLDSVWVHTRIPMGWTLSNHMNIYIHGPYYLNSFDLVGLCLTYAMNWYDPALICFF